MRVIAAQTLLAVVFLAALLHAEGVGLPFSGDGGWTVRVAFADAGGLRDGSRAPVTVAGVATGAVERVRYDPARGRAVATLRLDARARGVLRGDATATVVPRSALQDLTVELGAGSPRAPALRDGGWIAASHAAGPVALDRVADTLDTDTRAQAQVLLGQLAAGLDGRAGRLRDAVRRLSRALDPAGAVTAALAERRRSLTRLVDALAAISGALGAHDRALADALRAGRRTLQVASRREGAVAATVDELAPALTTLRRALAATDGIGGDLRPALQQLRPAARALPAALGGAIAAAPEARTLLARLAALERDGGPALRDARRAAQSLPGLTRTLTPALRDASTVLHAVDAHRDGIGLLGERFSGVLSTSDANGVILRGLGFFEPFNPEDFGEPGATGARLAALKAKAVRALVRTCERENQVACLARYLVPGLPGSVR
ncbi:MAG: phospholipid/cholesterol/gamma-HCH transport system substrate-binding protein [Solirubrobacteraceae bacterium]|nr:phospholipid/cholesterol/gamma-HCH transport system substrate-binding protein [Solirubrobacteraceae bacterium]